MQGSSCDRAGLGSKSRAHLWLLAPAQRGCWKPSNVNGKSGCPNGHALAVTEVDQKAFWSSCLQSRETTCWKPSAKEYFCPSTCKELLAIGGKDATDSKFTLSLKSNWTNAWDKVYLGPPSTITKMPEADRTRDREIFRGGISPQLRWSCNRSQVSTTVHPWQQGTDLDEPQHDSMSNISR